MDSEKKGNWYETKVIIDGIERIIYTKFDCTTPEPKINPDQLGFMVLNFNKNKDGRE